MKKIIIAYASAGAGHRKAAEAIYDFFKENSPKDEIILIDALDKTNPVFKYFYSFGYAFLINNALWLWGFLFWVTSFKILKRFSKCLSAFFNRLNSRRLSNFLIQEQPDIIISTHFLPPEIASHLKKRGKIKSMLATVLTDFGAHPFWITPGTDLYIVASGLAQKQLISEGISLNKIKDLGIPIDAKFTKNYPRQDIAKKLGVKAEEFTALITTGSSAIGPIDEIVDLLTQVSQVLVVCAKNKDLYKRLNQKKQGNLKVFGFVDNIEELMAVSDVVIAKPGGLTTSEILSMEMVPIFISPIPGQEEENVKAMQAYGLGNLAKSPREIMSMVTEYKRRPEKLLATKEIIRKVKRPSATEEIYNALR